MIIIWAGNQGLPFSVLLFLLFNTNLFDYVWHFLPEIVGIAVVALCFVMVRSYQSKHTAHAKHTM